MVGNDAVVFGKSRQLVTGWELELEHESGFFIMRNSPKYGEHVSYGAEQSFHLETESDSTVP